MARFSGSGFDELNNVYHELKDIPQDVTEEMLETMGSVAMERIRETGEAMGVRDPESTEHILDKLRLTKVTFLRDGGLLYVKFKGNRANRKKKTRNTMIAFINEFGKRGQPARPFMKTALDKSADEISQAGADKLFAWQESKFEK